MTRWSRLMVLLGGVATLSVLLFSGAIGSTAPSQARDKPSNTSTLNAYKLVPAVEELDNVDTGNTGGQFSKVQIERLRCSSSGDPPKNGPSVTTLMALAPPCS